MNQPPKPTLVVVSHGITPYGVHFLRRVADEMSDFTLRTIYSYEFSNGRWSVPLPSSINAVVLGKGEETGGLSRLVSIRSGWTRYRELVKEIRASRPAALMILGYGWLAHFLTIAWCHRQGIPVLLWGDSNILLDNAQGAKAWIKTRVVTHVVAQCCALLPCGTLGARYFEKYGARPEQMFYMPNEPDYSLIEHADPALVESLRAEFRLSSARRRLLFSGRLVALKRIDLLIDAFAKLAARRPEWDLVIAGGGPEEATLRALVPNHLAARVLWTGYQESADRILGLYGLCDALALPSETDAWALVVNEAACAGLALVCSDVVGAAAELLRDGVNGRLFKTNDLEALTTALLDVTDEANLARYKTASPEILANWRKAADPVDGLRRALARCRMGASVTASSC